MSVPLPTAIIGKLQAHQYGYQLDTAVGRVWRFRSYDCAPPGPGDPGGDKPGPGENSPPVPKLTGPGFDGGEAKVCLGVSSSWDASTSYAAAKGATVSSYDWDWGDSTAHGATAVVSHTYTAAGTYTVTLTLTDSNAMQGKVSFDLTVIECNSCANRALAVSGQSSEGHISQDGGSSWRKVTLAGNSHAVAFDPRGDHVYFGIDDGSVQRTSDAGVTLDVTTVTGGGAIYALRVDPVNRNVVWAGDNQGRLYRSNDHGLTFALVLTTGWGHAITQIIVDPMSSHHVLWCGQNAASQAAVGESTDWGATWQQISGDGGWNSDHSNATDLQFSNTSTAVVYVSLSGGPAATSVRRGTKLSSGWSWQESSGITEDLVGITGKLGDGGASWAGGNSTKIWRSTAWPVYTNPGNAPSTITRVLSDGNCADQVWAALADGVAMSDDSGVTFTRKLTSAQMNALAMGPIAEAEALKDTFIWVVEANVIELFDSTGALARTIARSGIKALCTSGDSAIGLYYDGGWQLWRTDDGGATSASYSIGTLASANVMVSLAGDAGFSTVLAGFGLANYLATGDMYLHRSTNGGAAWAQVYTYTEPPNANYQWAPLALAYAGGFIMGVGGGGTPNPGIVVRESTAGADWTDSEVVSIARAGDKVVLTLFVRGSTVWAFTRVDGYGAGTPLGLAKRVTGSWTALNTAPSGWTAAAVNVAEVIVGANDDGNQYSADNGLSFTTIAAGQLSVGIADVDADPESTADFYCIQNVGGAPQIKRSVDNGITWTKFCDLADNGIKVRVARV